jgi:hypothetical protein
MTTSTKRRYHDLADVATQLGIPVRSLREAARRGEFTHLHIGRKRLLTDEHLAELLKRYERRPAAKQTERQRPARRRRTAA